MTSVLITCKPDGTKFVDVDGKRLERVVSLSLEVTRDRPTVEIIQHDENFNEFSHAFVPTAFELRTTL